MSIPVFWAAQPEIRAALAREVGRMMVERGVAHQVLAQARWLTFWAVMGGLGQALNLWLMTLLVGQDWVIVLLAWVQFRLMRNAWEAAILFQAWEEEPPAPPPVPVSPTRRGPPLVFEPRTDDFTDKTFWTPGEE